VEDQSCRRIYADVTDNITLWTFRHSKADLKDEYNSYIGKIYRLLASKASEADIVELLYKIEKEEMGSSPDEERLRPVAAILFKLNVSL